MPKAAAAPAPIVTTGDAEAALTQLEECIRTNYRKGASGLAVVRDLASAVATAEAGKPVAQDTDLVEVAFRAVLVGLVRESLAGRQDLLDEEKFGMRALLDLALGLAQGGGGEGTGLRSVFFLLEDVFEFLGVEQIQTFWPEVEAREEALFALFKVARKSNLTMLKLCNSLLRKLSKSHNTAICGRIMMYLSRNWELSDPSAINKGGASNVGNKTVYEDSDEFARQEERLAEKKRRDEELRAAVEGGGKAKDEEEQQEPIDYSLYQTFWGLQEDLSEPTRVMQSDDAWREFVGKAKEVLQAFEGFTVNQDSAAASAVKGGVAAVGRKVGKAGGEEGEGKEGERMEGKAEGEGKEVPMPEEEVEGEEEGEERGDEEEASSTEGSKKKRSRKSVKPSSSSSSTTISRSLRPQHQHQEQEDEKDEEGTAYLGCKYLTNSRLFRLQLHDPLVRVQVLSQLLILLNYVSASAALSAISSLPPSSSSTSTPTTTSTPPASSKPGAIEITKHARRLIRSTPTHGSTYLATLDTVLDREKAWLAWKKLQRCEPKIEKPRAPPAKATRTLDEVKKALAVAGKPTLVVAQQQRTFYGRALPLPRPVDLDAIEAEVGREGGRTWETYVKPRMEEAEDPEACIDEEYHPRHEPVFCWRALRLAWVADVKSVVGLKSGGLDGIWRRMTGKEEEEEEEEEVVEDMEEGGEKDKVVKEEEEEGNKKKRKRKGGAEGKEGEEDEEEVANAEAMEVETPGMNGEEA